MASVVLAAFLAAGCGEEGGAWRATAGDTFRTESRKRAVRLANVDAPEKGRPGSKKATDALTKMVMGKQVTVDTVARDKYGRSVAKVKVSGKSVNKAMRKKLK